MKRLAALALLLLPSTGCAERQFDGPESDLLPICMLYPARGWDEYGNGKLMVAADGSTGRTCDCMSQEEYDQDLRLDEFHERALQECLQLAAAFETNDCQELHDAGEWLASMQPARDHLAWLTIGKDLDCSEQAHDARGCATTPDARSSPLWLFAILLGLGLVRGPARRCSMSAARQRRRAWVERA